MKYAGDDDGGGSGGWGGMEVKMRGVQGGGCRDEKSLRGIARQIQ